MCECMCLFLPAHAIHAVAISQSKPNNVKFDVLWPLISVIYYANFSKAAAVYIDWCVFIFWYHSIHNG